MKARLETKHPRIRCQQCGDSRVAAVCHHCGAALCAQHEREAAGSMAQSFEFTGLNLDPDRAAHCRQCAHSVPNPISLALVLGLTIGGVVLGMAGLALGPVVVGLGGVLLLAGGVVAIMRSQRWQRINAQRPDFSAFLQIRSFEVRETLRARQRMQADGRSVLEVLDATGHANVLATLTEMDRERLTLFLKKYRQGGAANLPVCAGFVGFEPAVSQADGGQAGGNFTTLLPLRSTVAQLPFLNGDSNKSATEWRQEVRYGVGVKTSGLSMPVRIVPSLVHDRDKRDLQFELSWMAHGGAPLPKVEQIELLEISYPSGLGTAVCRDGLEAGQQPKIDANGNAWLTVRVVRPSLKAGDAAGDDRQPGVRRFYFQFENPIEPDQSFHGRAVVILQGALSGLERASLYSPLGFRREQNRAGILTRIELEFELSTTPLLYSVLKLMPGGKAAPNKVFEGVNASPELVVALTEALGASGFYVKSVTEENPKQHHGGGSQLRHRTWVLLGRRYHGVHPTDFHLVLQGEESPAQRRSRLTVSLNAQGSHADQDAGHRIEDDWKEVLEVLCSTVSKMPVPDEPMPAPRVAAAEAVRPPVTGGGGPSTPHATPSAARDRLIRAYVEGTVPEALFRELLAGLDGASGVAANYKP